MRTVSLIRAVLMAILFAFSRDFAGSVPHAEASAQCDAPITLADSAADSESSSTCYAFNVPVSSGFLQVSLQPSGGGTFDLYETEGQVQFLSDDYKADDGGIASTVAYVYLQPASGIHTIAVMNIGGTGSFQISVTTVGAPSSGSSQASVQCSGDICQSSEPLTGSGSLGNLTLGSAFGARVIIPIRIGRPGVVDVRATWTGSARTLSLILNGPDRPLLPNPKGYYARQDGGNPLELAYSVTSDDILRGRSWRVSVVNFGGGLATGNVSITYPNPGASTSDRMAQQASARSFIGLWQNIDANTRGITKMSIDGTGNSLSVHSWGACLPSDCDQGSIPVGFQGNPVEVSRTFSFKREILTIGLLSNGELRVLDDNAFTDGSHRDYVSEYYFYRVIQPPIKVIPIPPVAPGNLATCKFVLGFETLHDLIPNLVGDCLVDEHHNELNGDGLQETTGPIGAGGSGLLVWRKADNWTAYTDGYRTWINAGACGLVERLNSQRFDWEVNPDNLPVVQGCHPH